MNSPYWRPLKETVVIGLGAKARSGKDTVAAAIANQQPGVKVQGFAVALKAYCHVAHGMREKDSRLLQVVGTDVWRHLDPDIWVRVLHDMTHNDPPRVLIVPDVRFPNEADFIHQVGGYLARIDRIDRPIDRDPNHPSETALDTYTGWHDVFSVPEHIQKQPNGGVQFLREQVAPLVYERARGWHVRRYGG